VFELAQKYDVCIWAKNGARYLNPVLKRIDTVIPKENRGKKIFVDDSSIDNSVEIAKKLGWTVYPNKRGGVSGGFNEALKHVETEQFISIEQDVILGANWFNVVPKLMEDKDVAVAAGIRIPSHPILRAIYEDKLQNEFAGEILTSLDNNVWRTDAIRDVGGIPTDQKSGADKELFVKLAEKGYKWVVTRDVKSIHIRDGIKSTLEHYRSASLRSYRKQRLGDMNSSQVTNKFRTGMERALRIAVRKNEPSILAVYPYMCLMNFKTRIQLKNKRFEVDTPFRPFMEQPKRD
jgi:GT2 family glycosyltransferase